MKLSIRYDSISRWAGTNGCSTSHLVSGFEVRKKGGSVFLKLIAKWCNSLTFSGFLGIGPSTSSSRIWQNLDDIWRRYSRSVSIVGLSDSVRPTGILLDRSTGVAQSTGGVTVHCFRSMNIGRPSGMAIILRSWTLIWVTGNFQTMTYLSHTTKFVQMIFFNWFIHKVSRSAAGWFDEGTWGSRCRPMAMASLRIGQNKRSF